MSVVRGVNLALSFFLEIGMLAALSYWGFTHFSPRWVSTLFGIGIPAVVIAFWGVLMAPKANMRVPDPWYTVFALILGGLAGAALYFSGHRSLAWTYGALVVLNQSLRHALRP